MRNMRVRVLLVFAVFTGFTVLQCKLASSVTTSLSSAISDGVTFIHKTFPVPPSMRAIIEYHVYYPKNAWMKWRHYPMIGIYTTPDHINIRNQCTKIHHGQVQNSNLHAHLREDVCKTEPSDKIHCSDRITIQDFVPRNFSFSIGLRCDEKSSNSSLRGLYYNISISAQTNKTKCIEVPVNDTCYRYMQFGVLPNLLGEENAVTDKVARHFQKIKLDSSCYQYKIELFCYLHLNKCNPKELFLPVQKCALIM